MSRGNGPIVDIWASDVTRRVVWPTAASVLNDNHLCWSDNTCVINSVYWFCDQGVVNCCRVVGCVMGSASNWVWGRDTRSLICLMTSTGVRPATRQQLRHLGNFKEKGSRWCRLTVRHGVPYGTFLTVSEQSRSLCVFGSGRYWDPGSWKKAR